MTLRITDKHRARTLAASNAQGDRGDLVTSGLRLRYQEQIRLKKQAPRRKKRTEERAKMKIVVETFDVGKITGRRREAVVDMMERLAHCPPHHQHHNNDNDNHF